MIINTQKGLTTNYKMLVGYSHSLLVQDLFSRIIIITYICNR